MRDGVHLDVGIWMPNVPVGVKMPIILTLTPYGILDYTPAPYDGTTLPDTMATWFVPRGYARAFADVRGTRNSEGCYDYGGLNERHDGYDLVQWLGTRSWSNGKVGMIGTSYEGTTALAAASEHPSHLAAIVPEAAINKWYDYAYQQGARYFGNSENPSDEGIDTPAGFTYGFGIIPPFDPGGQATNIVTRISPCDRLAQDQHGYNPQPDYDQYWRDRDYLAGAASSGIPTWVVHGLQDNNVRTWEGTEVFLAATGPRKLCLGVWPHADGSGCPHWQADLTAWWDKYLMGIDSGIDRQPPVEVQGRDGKWQYDTQWPPAGTGPVTLFLHPGSGSAGKLDRATPLNETPQTYLDDPTLSENRMLLGAPGGGDPAFVSYVTAPLAAPVRISGRPYLDLYASSDATETHYTMLLCDVDATGKWSIVMRGFGNARYRDGLTSGKDLTAGSPYRFQLNARDDDLTLAAGHSVGLVLSSSNLVWALPDAVRANNTILHTTAQPSALVLPVVGGARAVTTVATAPLTAARTGSPNTSAAPPLWRAVALLILAIAALMGAAIAAASCARP